MAYESIIRMMRAQIKDLNNRVKALEGAGKPKIDDSPKPASQGTPVEKKSDKKGGKK